MRQQFGKLIFAGERIDALQFGLKRCRGFLLDKSLVHATGVVVTDLLCIGVASAAARGGTVENFVEYLPVVLLQVVKLVGIWRIVRNRMQLTPVAASVTVEVDAGIRSRIHKFFVQAGDQLEGARRLARSRRTGLRKSCASGKNYASRDQEANKIRLPR